MLLPGSATTLLSVGASKGVWDQWVGWAPWSTAWPTFPSSRIHSWNSSWMNSSCWFHEQWSYRDWKGLVESLALSPPMKIINEKQCCISELYRLVLFSKIRGWRIVIPRTSSYTYLSGLRRRCCTSENDHPTPLGEVPVATSFPVIYLLE